MMIPLILLMATATLDAVPPASAPAINEWCPVLTGQKADPEISTTYRGKTVAFCCGRCLAKFKANPEEYVHRLPQFADAVTATQAEATSSHGHDHSDASSDGSPGPATDNHHSDTSHQHRTEDERAPLLGRLHPAIVHFPIAGIILAFMGFTAWVLTGRDAFAKADVVPLLVGTLAAVAAVITGNIAHDSARVSASLHVIVERHQIVATGVMILALCLSVLRISRWNRMTGRWCWVYGAGLFAGVVLVGITGYLGGSVVFGPDHFKW